jgi:hypothetical protein
VSVLCLRIFPWQSLRFEEQVLHVFKAICVEQVLRLINMVEIPNRGKGKKGGKACVLLQQQS